MADNETLTVAILQSQLAEIHRKQEAALAQAANSQQADQLRKEIIRQGHTPKA